MNLPAQYWTAICIKNDKEVWRKDFYTYSKDHDAAESDAKEAAKKSNINYNLLIVVNTGEEQF